MVYLLNGVFCVTLAIAIYQTMIFAVDGINSVIDGIKDGEAYIDNRHFILSWALVIVAYFVKSTTL